MRGKMSANIISINLIERLARIVDGMGVVSVGSNFGLENSQTVDSSHIHQENLVVLSFGKVKLRTMKIRIWKGRTLKSFSMRTVI